MRQTTSPSFNPPHPHKLTFSLGFLLACAYHVAQMDPSGLPSAVVAGVPGPVWRTWDILCAQWLLGRSFGHAVGASHFVTVALTNVAFPAAVLALAHAASARGAALSLAACSRALLGTVAAATAAKLGLEGHHTLPPVPGHRARNAGVRILTGLAVFPLPELAPSTYWFFHSLWHLLMGWGLHELYLALEGEPPASIGVGALLRALRARRTGARAPPKPTTPPQEPWTTTTIIAAKQRLSDSGDRAAAVARRVLARLAAAAAPGGGGFGAVRPGVNAAAGALMSSAGALLTSASVWTPAADEGGG